MDPEQSPAGPGITPGQIISNQEKIAELKRQIRSRRIAMAVEESLMDRYDQLIPRAAALGADGPAFDVMEAGRMRDSLLERNPSPAEQQRLARRQLLRLQVEEGVRGAKAAVKRIPGAVPVVQVARQAPAQLQAIAAQAPAQFRAIAAQAPAQFQAMAAGAPAQLRSAVRQIPGARPLYEGTRSIYRGTRAAVDRGQQLLRDAYVRRFGAAASPAAAAAGLVDGSAAGRLAGEALDATARATAAGPAVPDDAVATALNRAPAPSTVPAGVPNFDSRSSAQAQQLNEVLNPDARAAATAAAGAGANPAAGPDLDAERGIAATPPGTGASQDLAGRPAGPGLPGEQMQPLKSALAELDGPGSIALDPTGPRPATASAGPRVSVSGNAGPSGYDVPAPVASGRSVDLDASNGTRPPAPTPKSNQFNFSGADWPDFNIFGWAEQRAAEAAEVARTTADPELRTRAERATQRYGAIAKRGPQFLKGAGLAGAVIAPLSAAAGGMAEYGLGGGAVAAGSSAAGAAAGFGLGMMTGPFAPVLAPVGSIVGGFVGDALGDQLNRGAVYAVDKAASGDTGPIGQLGNALNALYDTPYEKEQAKIQRELNSPMIRDMIAMRRQEEQSAYLQQQRDLMTQLAIQGIYVPMGA